MKIQLCLLVVVIAFSSSQLCAQVLPIASPEQYLEQKTGGKSVLEFVQKGTPNIVSAQTENGQHVDLSFNTDATEVTLSLTKNSQSDSVRIMTAEESCQFSDGTVVFSALDATVHGEKAKLETHPGSHRIGFWSNDEDFVTWQFKPQRWGRYTVELLYSQAGESGNRVYANFALAADKEGGLNRTLATNLKSTDSWYTYRIASLGELYIDDQNFRHPVVLKVGSAKKVANAVMNLKAVLLRPVCEGTSAAIVQGNDKLVFHCSESTVNGVQLVYEPDPRKNTLGWWVVPGDKARWDFEVKDEQTFNVEVVQGCGEGQGGSRVSIDILNLNAPTHGTNKEMHDRWKVARCDFEVEDTGHFQNYKRRVVGQLSLQPGSYILQIGPESIANNAAMDLREIVLIPVKK